MTKDPATPSSETLAELVGASLASIPPTLREHSLKYWKAFAPAIVDAIPQETQRYLTALPRVFACSEFVAQVAVRHPDLINELLQSEALGRPYRAGELVPLVRAATTTVRDEDELKRTLRLLRRRETVRLAWRDLAGQAELTEVVTTLSEFADACLEAALAWHSARLHNEIGVPRDAQGNTMSLVVLGLGKLGGNELNFSSDIDVIFTYDTEGEIEGPRSLSHSEYFLRLAQAVTRALSDSTPDGFVFRVDTRLRPFGASGPLVLSFDAMEHYYQAHGREWERYALIKARVSAGDRTAGGELLARLKPFVYRRYLDYGALDSIREMKELIAREVERKSMAANVKLGPGGIREIEFIAQALQLIRGGREPALQERRTLSALEMLVRSEHLAASVARELNDAYVFLRRTEHCLQMARDEQTHTLPQEPLEQLRIAVAMGFPDWDRFVAALDAHRARVQTHFVDVLGPARKPVDETEAFTAVWSGTVDRERALKTLQTAGYREAERIYELLEELRESSSYHALSTEGRSRVDRLVPLLMRETARATDPDVTVTRLIRLCESIGRRTAYFALLTENPVALTQLVKLAAASPWIAGWISQHPVLLDELLDPGGLYELPNRTELQDELARRLEALGPEDLEAQMETLREFRHAHLLRIAAADIGPGLPPDQVGAHLSQLADALISACLDLSYRLMVERHGAPGGNDQHAVPGFAVIGYGKLGSLELGYASDLDIIFLYDEVEGGTTNGARPLPNELFFARLGQRLINLLTTRTPAGILYQVDMRLRPSGNSGPLVTSLPAFTRYQQAQAWTWEHQALVRARPIAGSPALHEAFEQTRRGILCRERDLTVLRREVREMRERMAATHTGAADDFDVKHDRGGIVDIEFMVQYWVLAWARLHPDVTQPRDNIHIMEALARRGLIKPEWAEVLTHAYRRCLSVDQRLKLMERGARVPRAELGELPDAVIKIWQEIFERE